MRKKHIKWLIIAAILIFILIVLILYYLNLGSGGIVDTKGEKVEGIEFLFAIYGPGLDSEKPYFWRPLGVSADRRGRIYVSDTNNHRICVFDSRGRFLYEFGTFGTDRPRKLKEKAWQGGQFNYPYGIDVADDNRIYVADMANGRIQVFSPQREFLYFFPQSKSFDPAKSSHFGLMRPRNICVFQDKVYVCDSFRVAIFDLEGYYLNSYGSGKVGSDPKDLNAPNGVIVGQDGTVYVSDTNNFRIQAFTPKGKIKWIIGGPESPDKIGVPRGLAIDKKGNLLVIDALLSKIIIISPKGKIIAKLGNRGIANAYFNFPNDIVVKKDGVVLIADKDNNRIQAVKLKY